MTHLEDLRKRLTEDQQKTLNIIFRYYDDKSDWPFAATLYTQLSKDRLDAALEKLGEGIVIGRKDSSSGRTKYILTSLGTLLTDQGREAEQWLVKYLEYIKTRLASEDDLKEVNSDDVNRYFHFDQQQSRTFYKFLALSSFLNRNGVNGSSDTWIAKLPDWVDALVAVDDIPAFFEGKALPDNGPDLTIARDQPRQNATRHARKQRFESAFKMYTRLGTLGQGGSGTVYEVIDEDSNEVYALKVLTQEGSEKTKRFRNEILFCLKNTHQNILTILDYGLAASKDRQVPFYVMALFPSTLRKLIQGKIQAGQVLPLFSEILNGIEAAHLQSVWHRDLKPENILYNQTLSRPVIADFGIAHFDEDLLATSIETSTSELLANRVYSAPEQRRKGKQVNHLADIYALGLILNEMFTGEVIQGADYKTIGSIAPGYEYLDALVAGMVKQQPEARFQTVDEIKQKLIGYKEDFVSRQRLSSLTQKVIKSTEVEDPLVLTPIKRIGQDIQDNKLIFTLSHDVTSRWEMTFKQCGYREAYMRYEPALFSFKGNMAVIPLPTELASQGKRLIQLFDQFVENANEAYKADLAREMREKEERERVQLQDQIEAERRRQEFLKSLET